MATKIIREIKLKSGGRIAVQWRGSKVEVIEHAPPPARAMTFIGAAYNPDDASEIADNAVRGREIA